jgi:hypothetical protein
VKSKVNPNLLLYFPEFVAGGDPFVRGRITRGGDLVPPTSPSVVRERRFPRPSVQDYMPEAVAQRGAAFFHSRPSGPASAVARSPSPVLPTLAGNDPGAGCSTAAGNNAARARIFEAGRTLRSGRQVPHRDDWQEDQSTDDEDDFAPPPKKSKK